MNLLYSLYADVIAVCIVGHILRNDPIHIYRQPPDLKIKLPIYAKESMARTLSLLMATFGRDLAHLMNTYFRPYDDMEDRCSYAAAGNYEQCMLMTDQGAEATLYAFRERYFDLACAIGEPQDVMHISLWNTCMRADIEAVRCAIALGANDCQMGLYGAIRARSIELIQLMMTNGAVIGPYARDLASSEYPAMLLILDELNRQQCMEGLKK